MIHDTVWKQPEGPIDQPRLCNGFGKVIEAKPPGILSFHFCTNPNWRNDPNIVKGEVVSG